MAEEKDLKQEETQVQDQTGPENAPQEEPQYEALLGAVVLVGLNGQDIKVIDAKEFFPDKVAQPVNEVALSKLLQDTGKRFERQEIVAEVQAAFAQKLGGQQ